MESNISRVKIVTKPSGTPGESEGGSMPPNVKPYGAPLDQEKGSKGQKTTGQGQAQDASGKEREEGEGQSQKRGEGQKQKQGEDQKQKQGEDQEQKEGEGQGQSRGHKITRGRGEQKQQGQGQGRGQGQQGQGGGQGQQGQGQQGQGQQGQGGGQGQQSQGDGGPGQGGHRITRGGKTMDKHIDAGQHKPKVLNPNGTEDLEANDWDEMTEQQKEALMKDKITQALDQIEKQYGQGGGGIPRGFDRKRLLPREDWKSILENFLDDEAQKVINDMKPNIREIAGTGVWSAGYDYEQKQIKCMIAVDVSGSIDDNDLTLFVTKIHEIIDEPDFPEVKLQLLFWDGKVEKAVTLDTGEQGGKQNVAQILQGITTSGRIIGGGGTDPSCINTWVNANKSKLDIEIDDLHILIMTDGHFSSDFVLPNTQEQPVWILNGKKATDEHIKANPRRRYTDIHFVDFKQK